MADTFARVGDAVVGYAVTGTSDMPDFSGDHFTWEGSCWEAVTDPGLLVATMDPAASPAAKEALTARIVQAMSVATKKLVVTEEAILNHATLIGQTVVDDINVQGKLVGTDGVFTGTVDFANVNVTGELLANEISGEHIYGTVIEGGEVRTGTDESRGKFLLGDGAYVNPEDGYVTPGLRFTPPNSTHVHQPALGVVGGGVRISGGKSAEGRLSTLAAAPGGVTVSAAAPAGSTERLASLDVGGSTGVRMVSNLRDDSENVSIVAAPSINYSGGTIPPRAQLVVRSGSQRGEVAAYGDGRAQISTGGATPRSLRVDSAGVWVTTNRSGVTESWNLEETASDTGWRTFPMNSALKGAGSPAYRIKSGTVFFRGSVTLPGASWSGGWTTIGVLPAAATPTFDVQRPTITSAMSQVPETYLQTNTSGQFQVWIPRSVAGTTVIQLSPMLYVAG